MTATEHAQAFTRALLGGRDAALSTVEVTLWTLPDKRTRWYPASEPDAIASAVVELAQQRGNQAVYLGVGLVDEEGKRRTRERAEQKRGLTRTEVAEVAGLVGLFADIDIGTDAHDRRHPYPPDDAAAAKIVESMILPPTFTVRSGHGIQPWWMFTEPLIFGQVDIDDDGAPVIDPERVEADRARAVDLVWSWITSMRVRARSIGGWHVDPTGDLARLLRAPGSVNRKLDRDHRPVLFSDYTVDNTYTVDNFTDFLVDGDTLEAMRSSRIVDSGVLQGVDVAAVWARVTSREYRDARYIPEWLELVLELDADMGNGRITATFAGNRPDLHNDGSAIDASLVRLLADAGADPESICEAVMCRRIRSGDKVDKVDPGRRLDYLERTVGRFVTEARRAEARREAATRSVNALLDDATPAAPEPRQPHPDEQDRTTPDTDEPADIIVDQAAPPEPDDIVEAASALVADAELEPPPPTAVATPDGPVWDWVDEDSGTQLGEPSGPTDAERAVCGKLSVLLGMPEGYAVWRVEWRSGKKNDEMRLWVYRGPDTPAVRGRDDWEAGKAIPTRWHPKSMWEKGPEICAALLRDCHVITGFPDKKWRHEGLPLLYAVFHEVRTGTTRAAVQAAIRDLLFNFAPVSGFIHARDHDHPWLLANPTEGPPMVAVGLTKLRRHIIQQGEASALSPEELTTMLSAMGCVVRHGVVAQDPVRGQVRDARTWIIIAPGLLNDGDWTEVRQGIADYVERLNNTDNVTPFRRPPAADAFARELGWS